MTEFARRRKKKERIKLVVFRKVGPSLGVFSADRAFAFDVFV